MAVQNKKRGSLKTQGRLRRALRGRSRVARRGNLPRLSVRRSLQHLRVSLHSADGSQTLVSVSSTDKQFSSLTPGVARSKTAETVGAVIAQKIKALDITKVAFDRSGYKYHGVVKILADTVRANGVEI